MENYTEEFMAALERTRRFGLRVPPVAPTSERRLKYGPDPELGRAIGEALDGLSHRDLVAQCLFVHAILAEAMPAYLRCPVYYTIGWVSGKRGPMFIRTEEALQSLMETGVRGTEVNLHAWLTLPSMEIIDASLPTTMAYLNDLPNGIGAILAKHPSTLAGGLQYHPMVIGTEYLARIGALRLMPA